MTDLKKHVPQKTSKVKEIFLLCIAAMYLIIVVSMVSLGAGIFFGVSYGLVCVLFIMLCDLIYPPRYFDWFGENSKTGK